MHEALFQPIKLGAIDAANRILMAPLTRGRADAGAVPSARMVEYYRQRASAGLILSEATGISVEGLGWHAAPGIWNDAQTQAWKPVTEAVHAEGGKIVLQLWHMGRIVHSDYLDGNPPVSASATTAPDHAHTPTGRKPHVQARAATLEDIDRIVADYANAARNAKEAGFDGVQLHGANGYLIDQFLRLSSNLRDDDYGGSPANRVRLMDRVLGALVDVWGADRVSIRLSPNGDSQGCDDPDPAAIFSEAARVCQKHGLGFVELRQPGPTGTFGRTDVPKQDGVIRSIYTGPLVLNSDYTAAEAEADVQSGRCEAISFGRPFISNPDLPARIRVGADLAPNVNVPQSWYLPIAEGYIDYPPMETAG
ncbi:alkene reductase [Novosphingobium sp. B 225]|uniref:alkene reductase n=1 Tax=Novosphingobium sp. B 225 TaxID=1961849 RepID=UPI000B4A8B95|nr:alkene reductase [Novosphingobium sp. B 225]